MLKQIAWKNLKNGIKISVGHTDSSWVIGQNVQNIVFIRT